MSSDPFADLAASLLEFAGGLRELLSARQPALPGSTADQESTDERFAGDWGANPSRDVLASVMLTAWSASDHLTAAAEVITSRHVIAAPYTLVRAASEAAATACYLTERGITPLERIRRHANCRLEGLSQQAVMVESFTLPEAPAEVARGEARIAAIARAGRKHGLRFHERDRHRSAYLGERPLSAMELIDLCTSRTPGLGRTYQRLLSGVAHAKLHGLTRFLINGSRIDVGQPGQVLAQLNVSAVTFAQELLVGPMCASTLVEHLHWYAGWDIGPLRPLTIQMLYTWGRIAGVPYSGPAVA